MRYYRQGFNSAKSKLDETPHRRKLDVGFLFFGVASCGGRGEGRKVLLEW